MKKGLVITWISVALLGLVLVGWAVWFQSRAGSYLAIPEIVGFAGTYIAFQGIATARRIARTMPPK